MLDTVHKYQQEFAEEARLDKTFEYLSECCNHAWHKVEKYYKLADETPIVYAAVVLNPTVKAHWFKTRWILVEQKDWLEGVLQQIKDLWQTNYKPSGLPLSSTLVDDDQDNLHIQLYNFKRVRLTGSSALIDQLDEYLATDTLPDRQGFDLLQYWYDRRFTTPELAKFAFDTIALPLMSDDPERSFSAGRDLITYRRSNLKDDIIEACSCLRSWYGPPIKKRGNNTWIIDDFDDEDVVQKAYEKVCEPADYVAKNEDIVED